MKLESDKFIVRKEFALRWQQQPALIVILMALQNIEGKCVYYILTLQTYSRVNMRQIKDDFKRLLINSSCSQKTADEPWKWDNHIEKKKRSKLLVKTFKPKPSMDNPASFYDKQICPSKTCGKTCIIGSLAAKIMGSRLVFDGFSFRAQATHAINKSLVTFEVFSSSFTKLLTEQTFKKTVT